MAKHQDDQSSAEWHTGQRVMRKDSDEQGVITAVNGEVKVVWDSGRTSYFRRSVPSNVQLIDKP